MVAAALVVRRGSPLLFCRTDPPQDPIVDSDAKLHKHNRVLNCKPELGFARQHPDSPLCWNIRRGIPVSVQTIFVKTRQKPLWSGLGVWFGACPL
jgi:hypothetical protein